MEDAFQARRQSLLSAVDQADRLADCGRFIDAADELRAVSLSDHSRLADVASEVRRRLAEFPRRRDAAVAEARRAHEDALQFVDRHDYRRALDRLHQILPTFQTAEMQLLVGRVKAIVAELKQLKADVRHAVAGKSYDGLLAKVERLVELEPGGEQLEKLLARLQARQQQVDQAQAVRAIGEAEAALQKNNYAVARTALKRFPDNVQDEELVRRKREADERVWLALQLRTAPRVALTLIEISKRLKDLQPEDERVAQHHAELSRRWKTAVDEKGRPHVDLPMWAKPPAETALGVPVDFAPVPALLKEPAARGDIDARRLLVAFGLAVQGIGRAAIDLNLAPREEGSWLEKMARFKPPKSRDAAWGIDFGAASLKAVRVSLVQTGKRSPATVRVDDVVEVPLEGPAIECDQPRDPRAAGEAAAFDRLRSERNISDECLVLGLPGVQSLLRTFPLPPGRPERLAEAIHYEVRGSVPLGEHELVYGSRRAATARAENNGSNPTVPVVAVAASRTHVNGRLAWLGDLATPSTIVQSSCVALLNALRFAAPSGGNGRDQPVQSYAIIDLGAETLNMVVDEGDLFWFRSSYGGMKPLNEALAQQLQLTHQQAAQLRQRPVAAHRMHLADAILRPGFEHLLQAVRRALDQNQRERNGCVATAYLCGGGASQFGLLRHFWFGG